MESLMFPMIRPSCMGPQDSDSAKPDRKSLEELCGAHSNSTKKIRPHFADPNGARLGDIRTLKTSQDQPKFSENLTHSLQRATSFEITPRS